jgi:hypothetical protein
MILDATIHRYFKDLFVAPGRSRVQDFSNTRLDVLIEGSDFIADYLVDSSKIDRVFLKQFNNFSHIQLSYVDVDADRVRGLSADRILVDEVQMILYDEVFPVLMACMDNSDYRYKCYSGTPLTMENTIEVLWENSTQNEWLMKCEGCNKYNYATSTKSIGKKGVICVKCGKYLNVRNGFWHRFLPDKVVEGFHIPQVIMPGNVERENRWNDILFNMENNNYPTHRFLNEVLGMSSSHGTKLLSRDDLYKCAAEYDIDAVPSSVIAQYPLGIVAGLDWSGGGVSHLKKAGLPEPKSRTVLWIWGIVSLHPFRLKTVAYKIFKPGENITDQFSTIISTLSSYGVRLVLADAGEGYVANAFVQNKFRNLHQIQLSGAQKKLMTWNGIDRYTVNKTMMIDEYFKFILNKNAIFPKKHIPDFEADLLNVYEEVSHTGMSRVWKHPPSKPDDYLMAQAFGYIAAAYYSGIIVSEAMEES